MRFDKQLLITVVASLAMVALVVPAWAQNDDGEREVQVQVKVKKINEIKEIAKIRSSHSMECEEADCPMHSTEGHHVMIHPQGGEDGQKMIFISESGEEKELSGDGHAWVRKGQDGALMAGGGYLGVQLAELTDSLRRHFGVREGVGVMVSEVVKGSPAERAGFAAGDVVTAVDGTEITSAAELSRRVRKLESGETAGFEITRDGRSQILSATVEASQPRVAMMRRHLAGVEGAEIEGHGADHVIKKRVVVQCEGDGECVVNSDGGHAGDGADPMSLHLSDACGDSGKCEVKVNCENGDCSCTVNGAATTCEPRG